MRWIDLDPEPGIVAALDHAGRRPAADAGREPKKRWSELFAHACAVAFADAFRLSDVRNKTIRPESLTVGTEPLTPLGSHTDKKIDVTVVDRVLGLEIGLSLKGLNFRDEKGGNFDKNMTGRLYEMGDEVRVVHEHLPHAFMAGVFFLPLEACTDKTERAPSSFATVARRLRERTGRLDAALASHAARCDAGFVALYATGDGPQARRGVTRFLDVREPPPRRGRPLVETTSDLTGVVSRIVDRAMQRDETTWGEAEAEP